MTVEDIPVGGSISEHLTMLGEHIQLAHLAHPPQPVHQHPAVARTEKFVRCELAMHDGSVAEEDREYVVRMEANHRLADPGGHRTGRVGAEHRRGDRGGGQEEVRQGHKAHDKDTVNKGHTMKCPRDNCDYDTATQPTANRSQQMELQLLRAHAVVVHVVGIEDPVFGCTHCGERCYPFSVKCCEDSEEMKRRCKIHDKSCDGDIMSMGHERRVRLEE
jgi:hypothetical protein